MRFKLQNKQTKYYKLKIIFLQIIKNLCKIKKLKIWMIKWIKFSEIKFMSFTCWSYHHIMTHFIFCIKSTETMEYGIAIALHSAELRPVCIVLHFVLYYFLGFNIRRISSQKRYWLVVCKANYSFENWGIP